MTLCESFADSYRRAFPPQLFTQTIGTPLSAAEVADYVGIRISNTGALGMEFELEDRLWNTLHINNAPTYVCLTADAGSGKSTFLQFFFGFYIYWRDLIKEWGFKVALERIELNLEKPSPLQYFGICVALPEDDRNLGPGATFEFICESVKESLLSRIPSLPFEDGCAMVRGRQSLAPEDAENLAKELLRPGQAEEFCRLAISYLQYRRMPADERTHIVIVIDDSDFVSPESVAGSMRQVDALLSYRLPRDAGVRPTLIMAIRNDTFRQRGEQHMSVPGNLAISLGAVDPNRVLFLRSERLKSELIGAAVEIPDIIEIGPHSLYSGPIAAPRVATVGAVVADICGATSESSDRAESKRIAFQGFIRPLCGDSLRRLQWFQERIAMNPGVEKQLLRNRKINNFHILQAALLGQANSPDSLGDITGVGEWFPRDLSSWEHTLFGHSLISSALSLAKGTAVRKARLVACMTAMGFNTGEAIEKGLVSRGFLQRLTNGEYWFRRETLEALNKLIMEPAYVEVAARLCFHGGFGGGFNRLRSHREELSQSLTDAKMLIEEVYRCEKEWNEWLSSRIGDQPDRITQHSNVGEVLTCCRITRLTAELLYRFWEQSDALLTEAKTNHGDHVETVEASLTYFANAMSSWGKYSVRGVWSAEFVLDSSEGGS